MVSGLRYVCSDMWRPYLTVIAPRAGQALHILDRFHIVQDLNQALDEVRRAETTRLRGNPLAAKLKTKARWKLLRRGSRVRGQARIRLYGPLESKLATGRAWNLKECSHDFWHYKSVTWAGGFPDYWDGASHAESTPTNEEGGVDAPQT